MKCKSCNEELVFLKTPTGYMPVKVSNLPPGDITDILNHTTVNYDSTKHISHFSECPGAAQFRKKNNEPKLF